MATRYLEADSVICVLDHTEHHLDGYPATLVNWIKHTIDALPDANVRHTEDGIWEMSRTGNTNHVRCSICKYRNFRTSFSRFCPNCGSYMRNYKEVFIDG